MRLLLIEDEDVLRTTLKSDLERAGFAVDCAVDGETGEFLGSTEHYDVTVLDLGLPRMNGLEILRRWRASGATVPVILLPARRTRRCTLIGSCSTNRPAPPAARRRRDR